MMILKNSAQVNFPVGCGAIKKFDEISVEIKRMFVVSEKRGQGFAQKIVSGIRNLGKRIGL